MDISNTCIHSLVATSELLLVVQLYFYMLINVPFKLLALKVMDQFSKFQLLPTENGVLKRSLVKGLGDHYIC